MEVSVLGQVEVRVAGEPVDLGTPKQRALVAGLALSRGWPASVDSIVDLLWGEAAPPGVTATLQAYVSQLRRVLEPERERRAPATVLVTVAPGYALRVPDESLDVHRFEVAADRAHRTLQPLSGWQPPSMSGPELSDTLAGLDAALALWRGTPYAELGDAASAVAERARLEELRLVALEDRAVTALALGRHATVSAELEALTVAHPLRERLWALRALALARSGRQADALEVLQQVRRVLDEELGLELSAELRELQTALLRQDASLDWAPPEPPGPPAPPLPSEQSGAPAPAERVAPWPLVGREHELATLTSALDAAERGSPAYAVLTGDAGIGKSRLAGELVARARARGARVLIGRCSQDDGAPPLWPWKSVLEPLGVSVSAQAEASDDGGQFRAWERIATAVRTAAQQQTTVVVLDDLHWADTSTLRVLRLLVEGTDRGRLLVLVTWRSHPEPAGLLAELAESFARMHAARIQLDGLRTDEVAAVYESVVSRRLSGAQALALRERTDGNPFFLVELARLVGERGDPDAVRDELPSAVTDVLNRRLLRLPERTVATLRTAAIIGRGFDTPTLAAVTGIDEDDLLDVVEPAQAAGLVREEGVDAYAFTHALVRDTLRAGLSASRRARAHARVAEAISGRRGRETELAWHWREAGPSYADRAWRAAVEAGEVARRLHAYDQAAELLEGALASLEGDGGAGLRERYDVLMALIEAYRWSARLPDLVRAVEEAIVVGKQLRDPEAVARAASSTTEGVLWRSGEPGEVNDEVVAALRGSLDRLPPEDSDLRCRTMLALANELYVTVSFEERRALCDEGLAMARRLGDPLLLMQACQVVFVALWTPRTVAERVGLVEEAMELARTTRSERSYVVSACLRAVALSELGRPREMWAAAALARAAAEEQRIAFGEIVIDGLELPWHAMAGRFEDAERIIGHLSVLGERLEHTHADEAIAAAHLALRLWQGRSLEMVPMLEAFDSAAFPFAASIAVYLWRAGEHDRARRVYAERGAPLDHDNDISLLAWCHAAELALYLGEPELAARAYELLAPFAGFNACAGSALALGPVDSYLAMAAAATGERDLAARHAEEALALAADWEVPLVAAWLDEQRAAYGF